VTALEQMLIVVHQSMLLIVLTLILHKFDTALQQKPMEIDPHRLCQRQKQIDYGKNTLGYERYLEILPR
jgi:hypothetical protein